MIMDRPELGTKCTCAGCGGRFYDMNLATGTCPKCGAQRVPEKVRAARPPRSPFGGLRMNRQSDQMLVADNAEPDKSEIEDPDGEVGEAVAEPDEEIEDDIEVVPAHVTEVA
jgi:uncharacterized protein (TIGR02300 family)